MFPAIGYIFQHGYALCGDADAVMLKHFSQLRHTVFFVFSHGYAIAYFVIVTKLVIIIIKSKDFVNKKI